MEWTNGTIPTDTLMNTEFRDRFNWLLNYSRPSVHLIRSTGTSSPLDLAPAGTFIQFNTTGAATKGTVTVQTNNDVFAVIGVAGTYRGVVSVPFSPGASAGTTWAATISMIVGASSYVIATIPSMATNVPFVASSRAFSFHGEPGDNVKLQITGTWTAGQMKLNGDETASDVQFHRASVQLLWDSND